MSRLPPFTLLLLAATTLSGVGRPIVAQEIIFQDGFETGDASAWDSEPPAVLTVDVVQVLPHDPQAFTQGLLHYEGKLYESTGLYGSSTLRRVDPPTGVVESVETLPSTYFGEGLARVADRLVQLTWREGVALVWDRDSFAEVDRYTYSGEGWGLCFDGQNLVMSDGSDYLSFRNPDSFVESRRVQVTSEGEPVNRLNELECAGGLVYANVWLTDMIVRIAPSTGRVTGIIDATGLLSAQEQANADVLNGIAYDPVRNLFMLTGKLWPKLFEVRFVPLPLP